VSQDKLADTHASFVRRSGGTLIGIVAGVITNLTAAACQVEADIARNADHDSADKTRRNATSSAAPVRRSFTPEGSSTSIIPSVGRSGSANVGTGSTGAVANASSSAGGANLTGPNPVNSPVRRQV
jgi:hypothetical protein